MLHCLLMFFSNWVHDENESNMEIEGKTKTALDSVAEPFMKLYKVVVQRLGI